MRSANVKDLDVLSPCNVGVNCARPSTNSSCGTATFGSSLLADGSQLAADVTRFNKDGASVSQLFANHVPNPSNVNVRKPGPGPAGANDLQGPHLEDEVYLVLEGRARLRVGTEEHDVRPGVLLFIRADSRHSFVDIREDLALLAVFSAAEKPYGA